MKNLIYVLFILNVCLSCTTDIIHLPYVELNKGLEIKQMSDSTFFYDIRSIFCQSDKYYVSEYNRDKVFILDSNLLLINKLGRKGRGAGELMGASHVYVTKDNNIYILNDGKRTIELFDSTSHIKTYTMPRGTSFSSDLRFCKNEDSFYFSNPDDNTSINKIVLSSDSIFRFGNIIKSETEKKTRLKNSRHLHLYKDYIVAIPDCQPFVEIYNKDGLLLNQTNLSNIDIINKTLKYVENSEKNNSYFQFFPDSYIVGDKLYILMLSIHKNQKIQSNKILQLRIIDNRVIPQKILTFGKGWHGPIGISEDHILVFNKTDAKLIQYSYE